VLGNANMRITDIYARRDLGLAMRIMVGDRLSAGHSLWMSSARTYFAAGTVAKALYGKEVAPIRGRAGTGKNGSVFHRFQEIGAYLVHVGPAENP
jgi:hypothetical protein